MQGDDTWMQRLEREQVAGAKGAAGMERRQARCRCTRAVLPAPMPCSAGLPFSRTAARPVFGEPLPGATHTPLHMPPRPVNVIQLTRCSNTAMQKVIVDERDVILAR